jgi:hypothetical protein
MFAAGTDRGSASGTGPQTTYPAHHRDDGISGIPQKDLQAYANDHVSPDEINRTTQPPAGTAQRGGQAYPGHQDQPNNTKSGDKYPTEQSNDMPPRRNVASEVNPAAQGVPVPTN